MQPPIAPDTLPAVAFPGGGAAYGYLHQARCADAKIYRELGRCVQEKIEAGVGTMGSKIIIE